MRATEPTSDDFPLELFSLQLELDDLFDEGFKQEKTQVQSPLTSAPGSVGCPTPTKPPPELMNLNDTEHLPSAFCQDIQQDFSTSLLDQLLMLQNEPDQIAIEVAPVASESSIMSPKGTCTKQHSPYQLSVSAQPIRVPQPMEVSVSSSSSASPRKIAPKRSRSHSHTPVTYPTPSSTPPSPYSPYYGASASATPVMTPSAVTPIMSPENSNPSSPRGSYYGGHKLIMKDSLKEEKLPRHKRPSHIRAEHKRRSKIQKGFEDIHILIPALSEPNSSKPSKSAMLSKTVDYCRQLRSENKELQREADKVRKEIEALTSEIKLYQTQLPASGVDAASAPATSTTTSSNMDSMFNDYVHAKTLTNWKFSIFGKFIRPLFISFSKMVNTSSIESFCRTTLTWTEEHCSLITLRPAVFDALRQMSTETSIMTQPERVPDEAIQNVLRETFPNHHNPSAPTGAQSGATNS